VGPLTSTLENANLPYRRDIDFNRDSSVSWEEVAGEKGTGDVALTQVFSSVYEARIKSLIQSCQHVNSVQDILQPTIGTP
jgi:hypothetical protein